MSEVALRLPAQEGLWKEGAEQDHHHLRPWQGLPAQERVAEEARDVTAGRIPDADQPIPESARRRRQRGAVMAEWSRGEGRVSS